MADVTDINDARKSSPKPRRQIADVGDGNQTEKPITFSYMISAEMEKPKRNRLVVTETYQTNVQVLTDDEMYEAIRFLEDKHAAHFVNFRCFDYLGMLE